MESRDRFKTSAQALATASYQFSWGLGLGGLNEVFPYKKKRGAEIFWELMFLYFEIFFLWFQLEVETFQKGKQKKIIPKIKKNNSQKKYPSKKQGTILTGQIGL